MKSEIPKPTLDQILENKFGQEPIKEAESISKAMFEQIKAGIADIGMQEGTAQEQQEQVKKYLEMWHEFTNGLFARTLSINAKSPEVIKTAVEGANSLLSVEPTREGNESAQKIIGALNKRYK